MVTKDSNRDIRARAVESLGILGDKRAVPALIAALDDRDPGVRREAVEALGKLKDPAAAAPLMKLLASEEKPYDVIWALGQIGDRAAIPQLTTMLESRDKYLAYNAMMALRRIR
ncbi:HEAT repeat domain-containing protein [Myxococcota bacterium]|nr:HEAT repeat domain-containing protein [Myxococcota bacterium]